MTYNTTREHLAMPEYGRNVHCMAQHLLTIEDPAKRLQNAQIVVDVMATLNPHLKEGENYQQMLWDHLHQMTGYTLQIEGAPFPAPSREEREKKPEPLPYPQTKVAHRHLGKNLAQLLSKGMTDADPEKKQGYTQAIGYYMKLAYTAWHKEPVHDDMIRTELAQLTKGEMQYETGGFRVPYDPRTGTGVQSGNHFKAAKKYNKNKVFVNPNSTSAPPQETAGPANSNRFNKKKYFKNRAKGM